jgi:hypothetical protein
LSHWKMTRRASLPPKTAMDFGRMRRSRERVAPETGERQVVHQAHTAENLDRLVGDAGEHFRGIDLCRGDLAVRRQALIEPPRGIERQQVGSVDLGDHVGELEGDALVCADRLAELFALCGIVQGVVEGAAGAADGSGGNRDAGGVEPVIGDVEALVNLAEDLGGGQAAFVEIENAVLVAAVRNRFIAVANLETRRAAIDEETGDELFLAARRVFLSRRDEDDDEISDVGVADEMFGAVYDPVVAVLAGKTFHAAHVRAGIRLGHGKRIELFTAHGRQKVLFALRVVAGHQDAGGATEEDG